MGEAGNNPEGPEKPELELRVEPKPEEGLSLTNLDRLHPEDKICLYTAEGRKPTWIAKRLGVSLAKVQGYVRSPTGARKVAELRHEALLGIKSKFVEKGNLGAEVLAYLAKHGKNQKIRLEAAKTLTNLALAIADATHVAGELAGLRREAEEYAQSVKVDQLSIGLRLQIAREMHEHENAVPVRVIDVTQESTPTNGNGATHTVDAQDATLDP